MRRSTRKRWATIATVPVGLTGAYGLAYRPTSRGRYYFRAVFNGSTDYGVSVSRTLSVSVR
jgi:hypothetical protein